MPLLASSAPLSGSHGRLGSRLARRSGQPPVPLSEMPPNISQKRATTSA